MIQFVKNRSKSLLLFALMDNGRPIVPILVLLPFLWKVSCAVLRIYFTLFRRIRHFRLQKQLTQQVPPCMYFFLLLHFQNQSNKVL